MWYSNVPHPFGTREILPLLVFRAVGGFFGVSGMYYSLLYMPLPEATVLTFLAPIAACYACSFVMPNEEFSRKQQLAGVISLLGVVLIAQPFSIFNSDDPSSAQTVPSNSTASIPPPAISSVPEPVDSYHHMLAIVAALCGVLGTASAITAIRWIGQRAHPLVSVTYFSMVTTSLSVVAVLTVPSLHFQLPNNLSEWSLLLGIGVTGFYRQYCLTAGLSYVPPLLPGQSTRPSGYGSRATSMVYTQMLFALFYDKVIWDSFLSLLSWAGSGLILGSAIYVAVAAKGSNDGQRPTGDGEGVLQKDPGDSDHDLEEAQGLLSQERTERYEQTAREN
jgi:drug/metabolite transporter (DMT)-like permease